MTDVQEDAMTVHRVAELTRRVFTSEARLSGHKLSDIPDALLIATPEAATAVLIDDYFTQRYMGKLEEESPSKIFMKVLKSRGYALDQALQVVKSSKGDSLEFLIEAVLVADGCDSPNFQDIAACIPRYNAAFPQYGRW